VLPLEPSQALPQVKGEEWLRLSGKQEIRKVCLASRLSKLAVSPADLELDHGSWRRKLELEEYMLESESSGGEEN
jgi:hypothetical protein